MPRSRQDSRAKTIRTPLISEQGNLTTAGSRTHFTAPMRTFHSTELPQPCGHLEDHLHSKLPDARIASTSELSEAS
jgi:hypothetical protein